MTGMNEFGIPIGPIDREPIGFRPSAQQEAILRDALLAAGVAVGEYDDRIIKWFAQFADWSTFAVMTSWVQRAAKPGKETTLPGRRCGAAHRADLSPCEGLTDAVLLVDDAGSERLGCVHHAARLKATVPCGVFPGPSAYVGYLPDHDAAREALARAKEATR